MRGWLIVKQGATNLTNPSQALLITSPFLAAMSDLVLGANAGNLNIANHNDLNNIQGGDVAERYHLASSNYNQITGGALQFTSNMSNYQPTSLMSNWMDISERGNYFYSSNHTFANSTHIHGSIALQI